MPDTKMRSRSSQALPDELLRILLDVWHAHRAEILLSAAFLLAACRFGLRWRKHRSGAADNSPRAHQKQLISSTTDGDIPPLLKLAQNLPPRPNGVEVRASGPRRVRGNKAGKRSKFEEAALNNIDCLETHIFFFTLGGSTKAYAEGLARRWTEAGRNAQGLPAPQLHDLSQIDYDDFFISPPKASRAQAGVLYMIILPSYNIDTELSNFLSHLEETHHDFRIDTAPLASLMGYSVFGIGDKQEWPTEQDGFCAQAIEVDRWMARLTARKRAYPLGMADARDTVKESLQEWYLGVQAVAKDLLAGRGLGEGVPGSGDAAESDDEYASDRDAESRLRSGKLKVTSGGDLEDIKAPVPVDFTTSRTLTTSIAKAMVPKESPTYASLTKQGYTIVGSHSGVKICRWTKSALRGRGSCYKYSFYGIASHQCMEATPSLSCSNKCVFCWRHGTNPVGTTWRWQVDAPGLIFEGMKAGHYSKIKMMRGVPGVRSERFAEAMRIRHCALSLVGEPIFYPHINHLLAMLHAEHISSFLVCNAQHPDQLSALGPVTQLYVSIDASNKESLRKIDRPLHRDFWERFIRCMDILREKRFTHRTVFRLTLVKGFNIEEEASGYAELVKRALPSFVEVKGVTYCGTSTAAGAGLSMQNVPFYEEVSAFVLALEAELQQRGLDYGIAAEHAHSCCILLADRKRYFRPSKNDGVKRWHTLIDYPKFFECIASGKGFGPEDYVGPPTLEWALWGNGGFDPRDERVDRKGRPKVVGI